MPRATSQTKKTTAKKTTVTTKKSTKSASAKPETLLPVTDEVRYRMITEAAYLIAEQRGFEGGHEMDDWLKAEAEIDSRFAAWH